MTYIPEILRHQVIERAGQCCEYCLIHQHDSLYTHEVAHITPEKHRGETSENNSCSLKCFMRSCLQEHNEMIHLTSFV